MNGQVNDIDDDTHVVLTLEGIPEHEEEGKNDSEASRAGLHRYSIVGPDRRPGCFRYLIALNVGLVVCIAILVSLVYRLSKEEEPLDFSALSNNAPSEEQSYSVPSLPWRPLPDSSVTLSRIAFGSCSSQHMPQPYWDIVTNYDPDVLLLMGDNVYGDCHKSENENDDVRQACAPLIQAYQEMAAHPSVQGAATRLAVFPTLDDHDYGMGDATGENPHKDFAKQSFQEFFQIPDDVLPVDGVYRSNVWGDKKGQRLQIILLDERYSKSEFITTGQPSAPYQPYAANETRNYRMLSEQQWEWLEQQLQVPADLRLLVSSIQVLNAMTPFECWRHIPSERDRLMKLLENRSTLIVSGDRHVGGFYNYNGVLQEVTASSWTHTIPFGAYGSDCASAIECDEQDSSRDGELIRFNHFGSVEIDWSKQTAKVALRHAQSSYGVPYLQDHVNGKGSDAGMVIREEVIRFPF